MRDRGSRRRARPGCTSRSSCAGSTPTARSRSSSATAPQDAFGFGVVFSDETLTVFEHADPLSYREITDRFTHWTDIDIHYRGTRTRSGGHGFSALGRRELLASCSGARPSSASEIRFATEAPPLDAARLGRSGRRRRRRLERRRARPAPTTSSRRSTPATASTCGWGPTSSTTRSSSSSPRPRDGVFQAHAYPYSERMSDVHRRGRPRRPGAAPGCDELAGGAAAPGVSDERSIAFCQELFADALEGHDAACQQLQVDQLRHGAQRALALGQRRAARRRRPHRPLLDRLGDQARHGGRGRAGLGVPRSRPGRRPGGARGATRPSAARRRSPPSAPPRDRWSGLRGSAATSSSPGCSSPSTCSPAAAGSPTTTCACATRRSWPRSTSVRRRQAGRAPAADVRSAAAALARAPQPRRRLADGHVLGGRRDPGDFHLVAPWRPGARRRRARLHRDDLRLGRRAGSRRAARGCTGAEHVEAWRRDRRLRPRPRRLRDRQPSSGTRGARARPS